MKLGFGRLCSGRWMVLVFGLTLLAPARAIGQTDGYVFVTSASGSGDFGTWSLAGHAGLFIPSGIVGGDLICRTLAADAALPSANSYIAWLSDGSNDAFCRMLGLSGQKAANCGLGSPPAPFGGPWGRVGSDVFATSMAALLGGSPPTQPLQPARFTETGAPAGAPVETWTGTLPDGTASASTCNNWSDATSGVFGVVGSSVSTIGVWTNAGTGSCTTNLRLLCIRPGLGASQNVPIAGGRFAFVTSVGGNGNLASWPDSGAQAGLAGGDAVCVARATAGGLAFASTFRAWLSTATVDARDRFGDGPWIRLDGLLLAANKAELTSGSLRTALDRNELADPVATAVASVWTGTQSTGIKDSITCSSWSSGTSAGSGRVGRAQDASAVWTGGGGFACSAGFRFYCLSDADPALLFADSLESATTRLWTAAGP